LLMVAALIVLLSFLGRAPHRIAVIVGGIGFGLFLDEVGKFVTKTNDYFYRPAVAIMYVIVVLLLVANRAVHAARRPSPDEEIANVAATAVDGLFRGLTPTSRDQALAQLEAARAGEIDPAVVDRIEALVTECRVVVPPSKMLTDRIALGLPERFRGVRGAWVAAVLLTVFSTSMFVHAASTLNDDLAGDRGDTTTILQFVTSAVTTLLCVAGTAGLRHGRRWALRLLHSAALITVFFVDVIDFAVQEFGALLNVAVGVAALSVFSHRLRQVARREPLADIV
jgi:hypothetical protein